MLPSSHVRPVYSRSLKDGLQGVRSDPDPLPAYARFNIAPTAGIAVIRQEQGERELVEMRWGLVPSWAKPGSKLPLMINARGRDGDHLTLHFQDFDELEGASSGLSLGFDGKFRDFAHLGVDFCRGNK